MLSSPAYYTCPESMLLRYPSCALYRIVLGHSLVDSDKKMGNESENSKALGLKVSETLKDLTALS